MHHVSKKINWNKKRSVCTHISFQSIDFVSSCKQSYSSHNERKFAFIWSINERPDLDRISHVKETITHVKFMLKRDSC